VEQQPIIILLTASYINFGKKKCPPLYGKDLMGWRRNWWSAESK